MRPIKEQQQETARSLFFQSGKTRAEIAEAVGVSEKTIYLWTKAGDWKRLRSSGKLMPSLIVENFYSQVQELNDDIRNREPGKRYASLQEAEVFRKLIFTAERIKKGHTQGENAEMLQKFMEWLSPQSNEHLKIFTDYADRFLKLRFYPYDTEYTNLEPPLPKEAESEIPPSRGDSLDSTTVESKQGDVGSRQEPRPDREPTTRHPELVSGTSHNMEEADGQNTQPQEEITDPKQELSPGYHQEIISQRPEKTGNNSEIPYEAPTNASANIEEPKQEITNELVKEEITPEEAPPLFLGEVPEGGRGQLAKDNPGVEIGYLGIKQKPLPGDGIMLEIRQEDPDIQRFSIGEAIYYLKKKKG